MRLASFLAPGASEARAGIVGDTETITAFADTGVSVLDLLCQPNPAEAAAALASGDSWPLAQITLLAPVAAPRAIFGIGLNYADHVAETGGERPK